MTAMDQSLPKSGPWTMSGFPHSDRIADIPGRQLRANSGHSGIPAIR